jgi:hypothetical protein
MKLRGVSEEPIPPYSGVTWCFDLDYRHITQFVSIQPRRSNAMNKRDFLIGATGASIASPAFAQFGFGRRPSGPTAVAISSREDGLAQAASLFSRSARSVVPAGSRVIAPFLTVEIVEEVGRTVATRGVGGGNQATSKFTIDGLEDGAIQGIVDRLYPQILAGLTSAGYTILTRDEARSNGEFAKLIAAEKPPLFQANTAGGGKSKFFAPTGMGPYFTPGDARFGAFAGFGMSPGQIMAEQNSPLQLSSILMGIELGVRFINVATEGGGKYDSLFGNTAVGIRGKAVMSLDPERTRIWFKLPEVRDARNFLSINKPVGPANNPIIAFDDITSNASKATDIAASLLTGLAGGGGRSYQTRNYRISLDRDAFPNALEGCLVGVSAAMISQVGVGGPVVRPR